MISKKKETRIIKKIITILLIFIVLLSGCGTSAVDKKEESTSSPSPVSNTDLYQPVPIYNTELPDLLKNENISDDYKELLNAPDDYKPSEETTYERLHYAYETGVISGEEYSKLLILLQYEPDSIPKQYMGAEGNESINQAFQYISENWDHLKEDTKKLISPFMLPIDHPESYYYSNEDEFQAANITNISLLSIASAESAIKKLVNHEFYVDNNKVTIQYYEYNKWSKDKKLEYNMCIKDIEEAIIHSYDKFENLLAVSLTKPVRIEVVEIKNGTNGQAWCQNGEYRIRLSKANYENAVKTKGVAAHELFHNFQYEMGLRFKGKDMKWLQEATAKWSEHYAFDSYNTEHGYLDYFFRSLDRDRIDFGNCFEYSGYMLFYYFSDYGQYNIVPDILWQTVRNGESDIREYLSSAINDMKNQYGDYAFINLNSSISKVYNDYGKLLGHPNGKAFIKKNMMVEEEDSREVFLKPGALQYYFYIFDLDEETKHVELEFNNILSENKYIKRQAIIKIDGKWHLEDWSSLEKVKYCRRSELNNENIQALLLIYSNSNFKKDVANDTVDQFTVITSKCPSEMKINIKAEYEYANKDFKWTSSAFLEDTVKIVDHTFFLSKDCIYKMEGKGVMEGKTIIETIGSFNGKVNEATIDNSMARLIMPLKENLGEINEELMEYGLNENTPKGGILITLPSVQKDGELTGTSTLYMPEPVGNINIETPFPFDGLSQVIAVELNKDHWNPKGFNANMTIDYFSHKPPIMDWVKVDFEQLQNILTSMNVIGGNDMQDLNQQIKDSGLNMEEFENMGNLLPQNNTGGNNKSLNKTMDALMLLTRPLPGDGAAAVIRIAITGEYTKMNE